MGKVTWKGGRNLHSLQLEVKRRGENFKGEALDALEESIAEGGGYTQDILEAAVTPTGLARQAESGGFPGRHDTGNMVGGVSYEVRSPRSKVVWGVFGWWGGNFEQYIRDQDLGEGNIPAARALPQAMVRARENFRRRMRDLVSGRR
jgi:hypothetical protein